MGWFDWLFGRKKKAPQVSTAAAPPKPSVPVPQAVDDPDEDWAEATTFISVRLSPIAQREIKNLRTLLGDCLLYTSPSPRDATLSRMPSSA